MTNEELETRVRRTDTMLAAWDVEFGQYEPVHFDLDPELCERAERGLAAMREAPEASTLGSR